MSKVAIEHLFTGDTVAYTAYDHTKTVLGKHMTQRTGVNAADRHVGPTQIVLARPMEQSTAIPSIYPHAIDVSPTITWLFTADGAGAGTSRRISRFTYNKSSQTLDWNGFITLSGLTTNHTIRGMRAIRETYSTGTVEVSGTTVTGTGTAWTDRKIAVGARIGFGSTNPNSIVSWNYITAIGSNTSITVQAGDTVSAGTPYVIEEIRILIATTASVNTNGGLFLAKGINADDFAPVGTVISLASATTDNLKALYWLADASTVTNTISAGIALDDFIDDDTHYVYVLNANTTTSASIFKYNIRAGLNSIASGKTTDAFMYKTGTQSVTGVISQTNNCRLATTQHGPGKDTSCMYFVTTTRAYRVPEHAITDGNSTFIADVMVEIPPGGSTTTSLTGSWGSIEYTADLDSFIITCGAAARMYLTKFSTIAGPLDFMFGVSTVQIDQSTSDSGTTPHINVTGATHSVWIEDGIAYICKNGTTALLNFLYILPISMHWNTHVNSDANRIITPALSTADATELYRVYLNEKQVFGSENFGVSPEPYKVYARTAGIEDNTGSWTKIDYSGDLTGISPGTHIQFMIEFRIAGHLCVPAALYGVTVVYEKFENDSHYQASMGNSSVIDKQFAWRFSTAFGGSVPDLRVRLYDAITNGLLLDDNTDSPKGTFERSTDNGENWTAWNNTDKGNETTYLRYTPASLGDNIKVKALLTQL